MILSNVLRIIAIVLRIIAIWLIWVLIDWPRFIQNYISTRELLIIACLLLIKAFFCMPVSIRVVSAPPPLFKAKEIKYKDVSESDKETHEYKDAMTYATQEAGHAISEKQSQAIDEGNRLI